MCEFCDILFANAIILVGYFDSTELYTTSNIYVRTTHNFDVDFNEIGFSKVYTIFRMTEINNVDEQLALRREQCETKHHTSTEVNKTHRFFSFSPDLFIFSLIYV